MYIVHVPEVGEEEFLCQSASFSFSSSSCSAPASSRNVSVIHILYSVSSYVRSLQFDILFLRLALLQDRVDR